MLFRSNVGLLCCFLASRGEGGASTAALGSAAVQALCSCCLVCLGLLSEAQIWCSGSEEGTDASLQNVPGFQNSCFHEEFLCFFVLVSQNFLRKLKSHGVQILTAACPRGLATFKLISVWDTLLCPVYLFSVFSLFLHLNTLRCFLLLSFPLKCSACFIFFVCFFEARPPVQQASVSHQAAVAGAAVTAWLSHPNDYINLNTLE